jgi:gas vesicle protein
MEKNCVNYNQLLIGALLGGLVVGAPSVLLSSNKLKKCALKKMNVIADFIGDLLNETNENAHDISENTIDMINSYKEELLNYITDPEYHHLRTGFIIGTILGGILGAGAMHFAVHEKEEVKSFNIKGTLEDILDSIKSRVEPMQKKFRTCESHIESNLESVVDLAVSGLKLWQRLKK